VSVVILRYHYQQNKGEDEHNEGHQNNKEDRLNERTEIKEDENHEEMTE
jgi:hypothetical protein